MNIIIFRYVFYMPRFIAFLMNLDKFMPKYLSDAMNLVKVIIFPDERSSLL
jgi:hypothetical protein